VAWAQAAGEGETRGKTGGAAALLVPVLVEAPMEKMMGLMCRNKNNRGLDEKGVKTQSSQGQIKNI
jgi:hypothetical protein